MYRPECYGVVYRAVSLFRNDRKGHHPRNEVMAFVLFTILFDFFPFRLPRAFIFHVAESANMQTALSDSEIFDKLNYTDSDCISCKTNQYSGSANGDE